MYLFNLRVISHTERKSIIKTRNMTQVVRRQKNILLNRLSFSFVSTRIQAVICQGSQSQKFSAGRAALFLDPSSLSSRLEVAICCRVATALAGTGLWFLLCSPPRCPLDVGRTPPRVCSLVWVLWAPRWGRGQALHLVCNPNAQITSGSASALMKVCSD